MQFEGRFVRFSVTNDKQNTIISVVSGTHFLQLKITLLFYL